MSVTLTRDQVRLIAVGEGKPPFYFTLDLPPSEFTSEDCVAEGYRYITRARPSFGSFSSVTPRGCDEWVVISPSAIDSVRVYRDGCPDRED